MLRKLCLITAIAVIPFTRIYALGLGGIHHKSYLNQKFNADIELLSFSQDEIDTLKVGLASAEVFAKAGVNRAFHLFGLRFEVITHSKGSAVIRVTSQKPIREPYLDFLIEAKWPNGTVIREYTVLLDPVKPGQADNSVSLSQGKQTSHPFDNRLVYGPINNKDTLWSIAKKMKQADISIAQAMNALLIQNPDAFVNGNPDNLLEGKTLRLNLSPSTPNKQPNPASPKRKPVKHTRPDKKTSPTFKPKPNQPQLENQVSQKFIRDEISILQETLKALHKSEQQRYAQNQELFTLIEALNFKINDIQLMLITQQSQIETADNSKPDRLDKSTTTEISLTTVALPEEPEETILTPVPLISDITPDQIIINPEATQPATPPSAIINPPTSQSNNDYTSFQIIISTFACLLLLLKLFFAQRKQISHSIDDRIFEQSRPPLAETSAHIDLPPSPPTMEQITETPSQAVEPDMHVTFPELQSDLEQELNQLLEEAVTSIEHEENDNNDYISKMVRTIQPRMSQSETDEQGIPDFENHLSRQPAS